MYHKEQVYGLAQWIVFSEYWVQKVSTEYELSVIS